MMTSHSTYAGALLDYWHGAKESAYAIHRDDGFSQVVPTAAAFAGPPFNPLEQLAIERATGRVLDVGAGVGRHAPYLQELGWQVTAIEIDPELVGIMVERGVAEPLAASIFTFTGRQFDTILMLMNGFGLVGTPEGAGAFFHHARRLLCPGGQVLCDSLDVRKTTNPVHLSYQETNRRAGRPPGQMHFSIEYQGRRGPSFPWLHLDFDALASLARHYHWSAEWLAGEENGHYLARFVDDHAE